MNKDHKRHMENLLHELDIKELLGYEALNKEKETAVYLSGSLVEGLGNSLSDIDIFIISERKPFGKNVISKDRYTISIHFYNNRRVDFEFWRPHEVTRLADKLKQINIGREFLADVFSAEEQCFMHRLRIGYPILNRVLFKQWQKCFDFSIFQAFLTQQAIHRIDGALEDVVGMIDDDDRRALIPRSIDLVNAAVDGYAYSEGNSNTIAKWRPKIIYRLPDNEMKEFIINKYWELAYPEAMTLLNYDDQARIHAEKCINFSRVITNWLQK